MTLQPLGVLGLILDDVVKTFPAGRGPRSDMSRPHAFARMSRPGRAARAERYVLCTAWYLPGCMSM